MAKKPEFFRKVIKQLEELKKLFPQKNMAAHIATATSDYGDIWGMTDKELHFALEKYKAELDYNIVEDKDLEKIIQEGMNLDKLNFNEDEEDEFN